MARTCDSTRPATLRVAAVAFLVLGATLASCTIASAQNASNARGSTPPNIPTRGQEARKPLLSGLFSSPQQRQQSSQQPRVSSNAAQAQAEAQRREQQRQGFFNARPFAGSQAPNARDFHANSQHVAVGGAPNFAPQSPDALMRASTNPQDAREALAKVPWDAFPAATRDRLQSIASSPTLYRRLPMAGCRCNPELFDFFLTYPNAVVELWKQMGYDDIDMKSHGNDRYTLTEKPGSAYSIQLLYQDSELSIVYGAGSYRGPASLMRPVEGEALGVLQTRYTEGPDRTPVAICRLDVFVVVKNPGVDFLARTLNSAFGKVADQNFEQTLAFIDSVSQTAETSPMEFSSMIANLGGLSPEARRAFAVKAQATARQAVARSRGEVVEYRLLAKRNAPNPTYARILSRGDSDRNVASRRPLAPPTSGNEFGAAPGFASSNSSVDDSYAPNSFAASKPRAPAFSPVGSSDEFSLADEGETDFEWESEEGLMTGEDFLASQGVDAVGAVPTVKVGESSLARVGAKPTSKPIAIQMLDDGEAKFATSSRTRPNAPTTLSTEDDSDDAFSLDDSSDSFDDSDDEIYLDEDEIEDDPEAPIALNVATKRPSNLPVAPHSLRVGAASRMNAVPVAKDDAAKDEANDDVDDVIEAEEAAEITIGEDGEVVLVFPEEDAEEGNDVESDVVISSEAPRALSRPKSVKNVDADKPEIDDEIPAIGIDSAVAEPYSEEFADGAQDLLSEGAELSPASEAKSEDESESEEDKELQKVVEEDLGANWTSVATPRKESRPVKKAVQSVEKSVKKIESNVKKVERKIREEIEEIPTMDRPRIITKRYVPRDPAPGSNGKPVSTFKESPRPAAKTAALPPEPIKDSGAKVPTFKKPDLIQK